MSSVLFGVVAGLVFGAIDVALMIPMKHPNKSTAMLGAFFSRFAIGFLIGVTRMPVPGWLRGLIVGVLISVPDAIVTKAYVENLAIRNFRCADPDLPGCRCRDWPIAEDQDFR